MKVITWIDDDNMRRCNGTARTGLPAVATVVMISYRVAIMAHDKAVIFGRVVGDREIPYYEVGFDP